MLQKFNKLLHEPLIWKMDGMFKRSYSLFHDEEPLAQFRQESGMFKMDGSIYLHEAKEPLFIFRPKGVFSTRVEVESNDIDFQAAKIKPRKWGGGIDIDFLNGNSYSWQRTNMWNGKWHLKSADGLMIAELRSNALGTSRTITIESDKPHPAELNLLIFGGWAQFIFEMQAAGAA
ncbi:MAG: hypothetical protein AB8G95_07350 [Anaerolineae bacterium]